MTRTEKMRDVREMEREHDGAEKKYAAIREKMMVAAVSRASAASDSDSIRVVEPATAPTEILWPQTKLLVAAAAVVGLVAGILLAMLLDFFFGRVHRFRPIGFDDLQIYATVQRDPAFVERTFGQVALKSRDMKLPL